MVCQNVISTAHLWDAESLKEESEAAWRSMTLDLRRWRRSCSSSLPGKAASSGVLQAAGDRPLFFKEDDVHPGCTRETGVEAALMLAGDKYTKTEATCWHKCHLQEKQLALCSIFGKINNKIGSRILHTLKMICISPALYCYVSSMKTSWYGNDNFNILQWLKFPIYCNCSWVVNWVWN